MRTPVGFRLVGSRQFSGSSAAADRESVYTILFDRPLGVAYMCWIYGDGRADWGALDDRGYFQHPPYSREEIHTNLCMYSKRIWQISLLWPIVTAISFSVWLIQWSNFYPQKV